MAVGAKVDDSSMRRAMARLDARMSATIVRDAAFDAAQDLEARIVERIHGGPASGAVRPGGASVASAPGEYPMTDKGVLASGISAEKSARGASVVSRASYSQALEFKDEARGGRPFMSRALHEFRGRIRGIIAAGIRRRILGLLP